MYYVITPNGVVTGKTLGVVNRKLNGKLDDMEFQSVGNDKIVKLEIGDLDFIQDKKRLSLIPISNLYKADNTKWFLIGILILQFFQLVKP